MTGHYMDDRQDKILTAGTYELADDYHARILKKVRIGTPQSGHLDKEDERGEKIEQ